MQKSGTGSAIQQGIQAATAAVQGLTGGNLAQAIAGGAAPYLAGVIKQTIGEDNPAANLMAHAAVNAALALVKGENAASATAGAAVGEAMGMIALSYYNKPVSELSEEEKQTVSTLATLAAGLAGGLIGDSLSDAAGGAQAGKTTVENNSLNGPKGFGKGLMDYGQSVASYVQYAQESNLPPEQIQADLARMVEGDAPEGTDFIRAILENTPVSDTIMALLTAKEAKDYALALLTSLPAERVLALVGKVAKVIDNKILISAAEKISTAKPGKQFTAPRDLNEQTFWKQVESSPSSGTELKGLNNDPRFPTSAGFQKMEATHYLPDGSTISMHYQYNANTGKAYDMKIVTPQRNPLQPGPSIIDEVKK